MPVRVYVHLTWTTLQRQPLINSEVADFLRRFLPKEAQRHGARVLEAAARPGDLLRRGDEVGEKHGAVVKLDGVMWNRSGYEGLKSLLGAARPEGRSVL